MNVSVIVTVKNEEATIRPLLESLISQTRKPDEVVVCDAGSSDATLQILHEYRHKLPLKIIVVSGSNISQGRNRAIATATGPIIAATDAGVVLAASWIEELVKPIEEQGKIVVGGWFEPDPYTTFEVAMGATVLPDLSDVDPQKFLPSSRSVAFKKSAWRQVGGYPEWLDYGEDLVFDLNLREEFGPCSFVPEAVVYFRPRSNLRSFAQQYYYYARGDGQANLWPKRHAIRYLTYLTGLPFLGVLIWQRKWIGWALLLSGMSIYVRRPAQRLWPITRDYGLTRRAAAYSLIPIIRLVGDVAKMIGYPVGWLKRWRQPR